MSSYKVLGLFSRSFSLDSATIPTDVQEVLKEYAENGHVGAEKLQRFLVEVQGEAQATKSDAEHFIDLQLRESKLLPKLHSQGLSLDAFLHYLLNPLLNAPYNRVVHHDMTKPLSHYYIYTGHNSYLTGNQLSSDCSEKPIISALLRGVRVIELDLWPDSNEENIHVLHGRTLTAPVELLKCIEAIKDHAFVASEFPVVITLEDHLTPSLQSLAAKIITRTLGSILYFPEETESFKEFPSPQSLKRRIIISTKPPKEYLSGKSQKVSESTYEKDATQEEPWGDDLPSYSKQIDSHTKDPPSTVPPEPDYEESDLDSGTEVPEHEHPTYKQLIMIHAGKPRGGALKDALAVGGEEVKRVSLSEPQLEKLAKEYPLELIRFTKRNILRIYPYGLRLNSSNYNPLVAWSHGAQMVALNMQGYGRPLWLVQGFFRANGGCGYVKKPEYLLANDEIFDPRQKQPVKVTLKSAWESDGLKGLAKSISTAFLLLTFT
ncbi:hypothetical protein O6H91_13G059700 [Diphasiastrum complanatum]|uniref:Uncharacterized protein n=1 Tax=Diphasiastrum complanatum TaxID=34168 RepID=A0ACC2BV61_DIPCM|nr:hypothetical protein O6H91_13G059700 [Diphasiastrum complanatum]